MQRNKRFAFSLILLTILFWFTTQTPGEENHPSSGVFSSMEEMYEDLSVSQDCSYVLYGPDSGVNENNPEVLRPEDGLVFLRNPHKFGYTFCGWYADEDFTEQVTYIRANPGHAITLYAKWSAKVSNVYNVENYDYDTKNPGKGKNARVSLLKDCAYDFVDEIHIPGMPSTKESDLENHMIYSTSQCPQGLEYTDDYVLLTSYSTESGCKGELMVFDRSSGNYLVTLGMDPNSHLGGIAFDGSNVWVCNSENNSIERLSYDFITLMAEENRGKEIDASDMVDVYAVSNTPSCITYYNGRLWVATHKVLFDSEMKAYIYNEDEEELQVLSTYKLPARVQGIVFDESGHVFLSTSYGRNSSSYLKIYQSVMTLAADPGDYIQEIELLPCSEELDIYDDSLYILFESAGEKYLEGTDGNGKSAAPLDEILHLKISEDGKILRKTGS